MKKKVFLVCTGLGRVNRGYESFSRECFDVLKNADEFSLILVKGSGPQKDNEIPVYNIHRNSGLARSIQKVFGVNPYVTEQFTFFLFLIPKLFSNRPALIYYSDFLLGTWLWHLRSWLKFRYRLLFSNGAPNGPPYSRTDHVQQLLPLYVEQAVAAGTPREMQTLLPYAVNLPPDSGNREQARQKLNLPPGKKIIISVGAVNTSHKRMDYVVREFSQLDHTQYFLVILGQMDENSQMIIQLAAECLTPGSYLIKQVPGAEVNSYLNAADYFILASFNEGLPRVLLEALSAGLLPIAHDYRVVRETLGEMGIFTDMSQSGILTGAIGEADARNISPVALKAYVESQYSWTVLSERYRNMIIKNLA